MPTNKIALRTVEEFMSDYTPVYQPLYPLFLGGKSQAYPLEVGKQEFRRVNAVGDIRAKHITPKDTEMRQISVMEGKKTYKKYFLANQFQSSNFQDRQGVEEVIAQVLDEHQIQMDELFLLGEGTSNSTMINNGLYHSSDPNYTLESSATIAATATEHDFFSKVMTTKAKADQLAGRKIMIMYGASVKTMFNSLFPNSDTPIKRVMQEVLGAQYSIVELPDAPTPSSSQGWIVANMDQCKLHYSAAPQLLDQSYNAEKMYYWFNFIMGSTMLEVLAPNGVIRQPATFA